MDSDHYLGWLALALTPGLGARMAGKLLREMGSPQRIFDASLTELESHHLPAAVAQAIHTKRPLSDAAKELAAAQAAGKLLTWDAPEYPARLREIYDLPLLYVLGKIELLSKHLISIVGSRRPTPYGNQNGRTPGTRPRRSRNRRYQRHGSRNRLLCAQRSVEFGRRRHERHPRLRNPGGLSQGEQKIFADMQSRGAIISEFPMGIFPAPQNFPIRIRMITGIALGIVVVEGAEYSGSLITARLAMEFGREVFSVPGNATQPTSFGPTS